MCLSSVANAQYFQTGQDPSSIKWRQINTENFQLIYPDYYEPQAQVLAQNLEEVYEYGTHTLKHKPKKISVILHTQTVKSNGLVAYAPKRSEFFTTPHQAIFPQDWLEQLAIHEFRHVVQIDKLNSELPGLIKLLLGEQGTALIFGAYLPWWFIEGDAVAVETALGNFGRGRLPSFLMEHKAQLSEKGKYTYDKAYLGSYKDYVPNHYMLGYHMVANTRERYGSGVWERVVAQVGRKPFSLVPFNKSLKQETGLNKVQLYNSIFDSLQYVWQNEKKPGLLKNREYITKSEASYTNYIHNHALNESEFISYKTSLNSIPAFVKIDRSGNEEKIFEPGIIFQESVNHRGEWVVWSEQIPSLRWSHSGHSEINLLNVKSRNKITFKPEFKAFAPAISPDLKKIVLVEADFSSNYYLSTYQISNGERLSRIQTKSNNLFFSPEWLNEREIIAIVLTRQGKRLAKFNVESGQQKIIEHPDLGNIKHLEINGNLVYFIADYSGQDALYFYNLDNEEISRVYNSEFGVAYPTVFNDKIILSNYTSSGYRLMQIDETRREEIDKVQGEKYLLADVLAKQEIGKPEFVVTDTAKYASERYRKASNLFNFHSWSPVFFDAYEYELRPGISLLSQNKLGTAETLLGYRWETSEKTGDFYARFIYKGWYPIFDFELSSGKSAANYWLITENVKQGEVVSRDTTLQRFKWNDTKLSASCRLPLNLSRGKYFKLFQPEAQYEYVHYKRTKSTPESFPESNYHSLLYRLYFHQFKRQSLQDVYPDFGLVLDASYRHSPIGSGEIGSMLSAQSVLYLPGIIDNHGLKIYYGTQEKKNGELFSLSDIVKFPRGWGKFATKNINTLKFDYKLPLINPDFSFGRLVYLKRISASLFYDYSQMSNNSFIDGQISGTIKQSISSYGVELSGDINLFQFYSPINIGLRTSYLNEIDEFRFDLLLSVDFTSL